MFTVPLPLPPSRRVIAVCAPYRCLRTSALSGRAALSFTPGNLCLTAPDNRARGGLFIGALSRS
ncbi:hypothetical protein K523DRAFT_114080 [Schizophyllum commune Tattone D]|nr:hypothetical protein K523DRAFT_114080 [Schizophyllum commune Tattone D]